MLSVSFARAALRNAAVGRGVRPGVGVAQLQVRDRRDVLLHRRQRAQDRRQLVEGARTPRCPPGDVASHRHVDEAEAPEAGRIGRRPGQGGHRGDHRVQQRQGQRRPQASEERPPRQGPLRDDHSALLIRNGVLVAIPSISDERR